MKATSAQPPLSTNPIVHTITHCVEIQWQDNIMVKSKLVWLRLLLGHPLHYYDL